MMSRHKHMALIFGVALVIAGCGGKSINQVLADPAKYRNQSVTVRGTVEESVSVLGRGAYRIADGDQSLWVVTSTGAPRKGARVNVTGRIQEAPLTVRQAREYGRFLAMRAAEDKPELIVDFATLTGAARIALGPELPAMFASKDDLAADVESASCEVEDPLWRMPLWEPYSDMLKSDIADIANAGGAPMAGCITAAMFLKRFVPEQIAWAHLDTYAWRDAASPGRPKGGEALGLRAFYALLQRRYGGR